MSQSRKFAFIAHYVEPWNWLLNLKAFGYLHARPELHVFLKPLFLVYWIMSLFYLVRREPFKVVDTYRAGENLVGYTILLNNFGWHFLLKSRHENMRQRLLAATLYAQNVLKVDVVGLGALTKDEGFTKGGLWLRNQVGVSIPIVHGDTCTAWFVIKRVEELYRESGEGKPIALIGPTSKIGRAVMLYLAERGYVFKAFTNSSERFLKIRQELPEAFRQNLIHIRDLRLAMDCRMWVTGKYKPIGKKLLAFVPSGATVLNFAVPDPLDPDSLHSRRDIRHFDGGLVQTSSSCEMQYTMRLTPHITYACAAGTMVHAQQAWSESEVGDVVVADLDRMGEISERLGLVLAPRSSHLKSLS